LVSRQTLQNHPDGDVFKFDHGDVVLFRFLIVKLGYCRYPACVVRYAS
jgi:hypothetical protein